MPTTGKHGLPGLQPVLRFLGGRIHKLSRAPAASERLRESSNMRHIGVWSSEEGLVLMLVLYRRGVDEIMRDGSTALTRNLAHSPRSSLTPIHNVITDAISESTT